MRETEAVITGALNTIQGMPAVVRSQPMRDVIARVVRVAQANAAVLITGESGVGKELIARAIHHNSLRCTAAWVDINCGALPEHLVESELFGHEKGAFSGADQAKPGLFELAHKGSLFLDEIGELPPRMQVKLLRVLDGVPHFRLGGVKKVSADVRIIAATNRNLTDAIRGGGFRSDLYHRLSQVQIKVPPLRERPDDIVPLAEFFLEQQDPSRRFAADALEALRNHSWPGNVRELRNIVTQTAILADGLELRASDLPHEMLNAPRVEKAVAYSKLDELERHTIIEVLERSGGHHRKAAEALGISRRTLSRKLKQYGAQRVYDQLAVC